MTLNKAYLIIGILAVVVGILTINNFKKPSITAPKIDTVKVVKTIDKPIYLTKWKAKLDTISVETVKHDTVTVEKILVAKADTLISKDSSSVKIKYYFPPLNYFDVDLKIKERNTTLTITKEIEKPESFWNRFSYGIQVGFGQGLINKQFDIFVGIGVHFRIK